MKTTSALVASTLSALGASACCAGPLLLALLGFSGATAARLESLEAFQPFFAGLTLVFIGLAFHRLYVKPRRCESGPICELNPVAKRQRATFWLVVGFIGSLALLPTFSELLF